MLSLDKKQAFLSLVRLGIDHFGGLLPNQVDWEAIEALATAQGLSAIVIDGLEKLPAIQKPPKPILLQWIGEVLQGYEYRYELYRRAIAEMASFYNSHGYKMMVLKGYTCSLDWPKPEHRSSGDIDIWQFGKQKDADELIKKEKGIDVDTSHHHHTVFYWRDFMVENHYDFVNVYAHNSSRELEKVFKELGKDDSHYVELYGERVYLPCADLHALFLIRHMVSHFAAAEISLRQVLDWAFFVEKHNEEVNWEWLSGMLEKFQMKAFVDCINCICINDLGFANHLFPEGHPDSILKERVLMDILFPEYGSFEPNRLIPRLVYKYRRWRGNAWKQELCYNESRWSMFWSGIWAKILKPASF